MLDVLRARWQQGYRTMKYPKGPAPAMPERFAGRPVIEAGRCPANCQQCVAACPFGAIKVEEAASRRGACLDMGRCLFCRACEKACPRGAIRFTQEHRLAAAKRSDLIVRPG